MGAMIHASGPFIDAALECNVKFYWLSELLWGFKQELVIPSKARNLYLQDEIPRGACASADG